MKNDFRGVIMMEGDVRFNFQGSTSFWKKGRTDHKKYSNSSSVSADSNIQVTKKILSEWINEQ